MAWSTKVPSGRLFAKPIRKNAIHSKHQHIFPFREIPCDAGIYRESCTMQHTSLYIYMYTKHTFYLKGCQCKPPIRQEPMMTGWTVISVVTCNWNQYTARGIIRGEVIADFHSSCFITDSCYIAMGLSGTVLQILDSCSPTCRKRSMFQTTKASITSSYAFLDERGRVNRPVTFTFTLHIEYVYEHKLRTVIRYK
jgi:hypothetical protein